MNYEETLSYMYSQLPMYQRIGKAAYKANLDNTIALLKALGNPQNSFKSIHVAGTNGKGSTAHIIASVLQESGYKTGLYTSPHLIDFRERIRINGLHIKKRNVVDFIEENKEIIQKINPSFFELTVALAFQYFKKEEVDIAVIETGLGGRLDSTNVILPELSIITNIGLDHTQFLGDNIRSISLEKGGIIKKNTPVIIGETTPETKSIFKNIAFKKSAPIYFAEKNEQIIPLSDLLGKYQRKNEKTAYTSLLTLQKIGWSIPKASIDSGFKNVAKNTGLMGRYQVLSAEPKIICDTAHNKEGLIEVLEQLKTEEFKKLHIVLGFVEDKSIDAILTLFPKNAIYYFCQASIPRRLLASVLYEKAKIAGLEGIVFQNVEEAFKEAKIKAERDDLIYVGGSTFVVADLLSYIQINPLQ